jgi:hypothetical protein
MSLCIDSIFETIMFNRNAELYCTERFVTFLYGKDIRAGVPSDRAEP